MSNIKKKNYNCICTIGARKAGNLTSTNMKYAGYMAI